MPEKKPAVSAARKDNAIPLKAPRTTKKRQSSELVDAINKINRKQYLEYVTDAIVRDCVTPKSQKLTLKLSARKERSTAPTSMAPPPPRPVLSTAPAPRMIDAEDDDATSESEAVYAEEQPEQRNSWVGVDVDLYEPSQLGGPYPRLMAEYGPSTAMAAQALEYEAAIEQQLDALGESARMSARMSAEDEYTERTEYNSADVVVYAPCFRGLVSAQHTIFDSPLLIAKYHTILGYLQSRHGFVILIASTTSRSYTPVAQTPQKSGK